MLLYSENRFRYIWNILVSIVTGYLAIYIPLLLIFNSFDASTYKGIYLFCSLVLLVDLIMNAYPIRDNRTQKAKDIGSLIKRSSWILIDLAGAIPFILFEQAGTLVLLQLIKLIRVRQYLVQVRRSEVRHVFRITMINLGFWLVIITHWLSAGWLVVYGWNEDADISASYVNSLYWTVTTMTSVGYGDIVPITEGQKLYSMFIQVLGVIALGYLIGNMVSLISKRDPIKNKYNENIELLTSTLQHRSISNSLQKRIVEYYNYLRQERMGYDESAFLKSLPRALRKETALELKMGFIKEIPLFQNAGKKFLSEIALKLQLTVCTPGAYIFRAGDHGKDMYFLVNGEVEVLSSADEVMATLRDGDFFGEIALFKNEPRTASIKARTYCNLYRLKRETFIEVINNHPNIGRHLEAKFLERDAKLKSQ